MSAIYYTTGGLVTHCLNLFPFPSLEQDQCVNVISAIQGYYTYAEKGGTFYVFPLMLAFYHEYLPAVILFIYCIKQLGLP